MQSTPRVIVVGGGLAGLVATRHLAGAGLEVTLLERNGTVGGRVRTVERDGFRFDRGFQVLFTGYPAVQQELDFGDLDLRRFSPGATIARPNHRSTLSDPLRDPGALVATVLNPNVSFSDELRVARLWWELRRLDLEEVFRGPDESIESYLRGRGFSDDFLESFVVPFYGGITLDRSLSTSKRIFEYTFRTLAAGSTAVPAEGMGAIPTQLADRVHEEGATVQTGVEVQSVSGASAGVTVVADDADYEADAVVVATDPPSARDLTGVDAIPTDGRGCVTQYYALPARAEFETGKRLLLNATDDGPNQIVPHSEVAPEYAPGDRILLSGTYLGDPDADDEELAERSRSTLESWYPERSFDGFECVHTDRIPFAQFVQPPGVHEGLPDARDPNGAIYLAGDYTHWSSIQGAIESGRDVATAVLEDLSS
ncbi:NAD(P)/FAD-dependent oxidoreductase [Natronobacterium gregoryi]|uniref:Amine oxidase n=2 Tax=Natronobacterium gregoryi TaxID=44930 RepID=L0AG71_NATGS|nr:NAD(P)/FAD-dependent oxidoreductase [Natronobacterium gregoryi]AFZ72137.1 phytoene dehydrogenase-like oxidoreductase [Natronobacterium gregoryi SP2]ELY62833.1 amine oxidase [Natronobacterium gregoryi SP2]PLK19289.1 FAD-dependent oxidoreductase [Natronobacterium gregoryi SP2]SFJ54557.1 UDP-galactopyranose mutase [Natronobacterium gregoryi]